MTGNLHVKSYVIQITRSKICFIIIIVTFCSRCLDAQHLLFCSVAVTRRWQKYKNNEWPISLQQNILPHERSALYFWVVGRGCIHWCLHGHIPGWRGWQPTGDWRDPRQQAHVDHHQPLPPQPRCLRHHHECLRLL